jgi:AcrR family transcriptional regulator
MPKRPAARAKRAASPERAPVARRAATRERLLDSAMELFVERGFEGTTVTAIERAVGLAAGNGSFYRHFRSKEDVLLAVVEREAASVTTEDRLARRALESIEDPKKRLALEYELRLDEMQRLLPLWRLVSAERDRFPELGQLFARSVDAGKWQLAWQDDATHAIALAALTGYAHLKANDDVVFVDISPAEYIAALVEMTTRSGPIKPAFEH